MVAYALSGRKMTEHLPLYGESMAHEQQPHILWLMNNYDQKEA